MANYKGILIGLASAAALLGLLFGTGVIKLNQESGDSETPEAASADAEQAGRAGKRGRRGRRRKRNLESLAYLGSVPLAEGTADLVGVQRNEPGAYDGYMLANAAGGLRADTTTIREAALYDEAKEVHRWTSDVPTDRRGWAMTRLDPAGFLYVVVADAGLLKLDWDSNVAWVAEGRYHHDLTLTPDGGVAALAERLLIVDGPEGSGQKVRLLDHGVVFFEPDGSSTEQMWLYEVMKDEAVFKGFVARSFRARRDKVTATNAADRRGPAVDGFHANSVVILPRDVEGLGKRGDVLLSLRNLNTIVVLDRETHELLWSWGPHQLIRQHDATLTAEGHIVLFDNRTPRHSSRAVVLDPATKTIVRTIGGREESGKLKFYSRGRGLAQFLPGGNIMVTVSNEGRAFEVDPNDQILWEFWSPWKDEHTRKPIRGTRLEGAVQEGVAAIVKGKAPPPKVQTQMRTVRVDFGVDPDHDEPKTGDYGDTDGDEAEDGDAQAEVETPTGQDTPVPPSPQ